MRNSNNVKKRIERRRKRKKIIRISIFIVISLILVSLIFIFNYTNINIGINSANNSSNNASDDTISDDSGESDNEESDNEESNSKETNLEKPVKDLPLKIETIPVNFKIAEENQVKVLQATFKNNSDEVISKLILNVKLKDTKEVIEMKYEEPVELGFDSNIFTGKAPTSGKLEDIEIIKYKITLSSGDYIEYDAELRQYNW